jgi:hypothetical protein
MWDFGMPATSDYFRFGAGNVLLNTGINSMYAVE